MADKLKDLGTYTFTDIICARLKDRPMRIIAAISSLTFSIMYLMVQVVGAGALIEILFAVVAAFACMYVVSKLDHSAQAELDRERFLQVTCRYTHFQGNGYSLSGSK